MSETLYYKNNAIKVKPIGDQHDCMIYSPTTKQMHKLNASAWFILECCDGVDLETITQSYSDALGKSLQSDEVAVCLHMLKNIGAVTTNV